ncbi:DUF721 domain-containing protein [Candidatus Microgenomates bacterium]|nr:DUF721 domain-containing protein [Candidatus Microgenomates bacterium]
MKELSDLAKTIIKKTKVAEAAFVCHVTKKTIEDVLGKEGARGLVVVAFTGNRIKIVTKSAAQAQEIKLKQTEILSLANERMGYEVAQEISLTSSRSPNVF